MLKKTKKSGNLNRKICNFAAFIVFTRLKERFFPIERSKLRESAVGVYGDLNLIFRQTY